MAQRTALSTLRNGLLSKRRVHSTSVNLAEVLSSPSSYPEPKEVVLSPIFDIFDVPSRLDESNKYMHGQPQKPSTSAFSLPRPRPLPPSLPPPIIFDGPAQPRNASLAFQKQRRKLSKPISTSQRRHHSPSVAQPKPAQPLVQLFEGPAKITRYQHKGAGPKSKTSRNHLVLLGLSGAVGLATIAKNFEVTSPYLRFDRIIPKQQNTAVKRALHERKSLN